jgi:hypothetical protein
MHRGNFYFVVQERKKGKYILISGAASLVCILLTQKYGIGEYSIGTAVARASRRQIQIQIAIAIFCPGPTTSYVVSAQLNSLSSNPSGIVFYSFLPFNCCLNSNFSWRIEISEDTTSPSPLPQLFCMCNS